MVTTAGTTVTVGGVMAGVLGGAVVGGGVASGVLSSSGGTGTKKSGGGSGGNKGPIRVEISKSKYPESAKHIEDAIKNGKTDTLTLDRSNADPRRYQSLKKFRDNWKATHNGQDYVRLPGTDLDEYPPAIAVENEGKADVRPIKLSDNRGSGVTWWKNAIPEKDYPNGTVIKIVIVP
jgi:hypothetical protein